MLLLQQNKPGSWSCLHMGCMFIGKSNAEDCALSTENLVQGGQKWVQGRADSVSWDKSLSFMSLSFAGLKARDVCLFTSLEYCVNAWANVCTQCLMCKVGVSAKDGRQLGWWWSTSSVKALDTRWKCLSRSPQWSGEAMVVCDTECIHQPGSSVLLNSEIWFSAHSAAT